MTTSHLVVWVIISTTDCNPQHRVTSIATAFGPPNFQMEITPLRLHIPYNPASERLTIGLNAIIQLKIIQFDDGSGGSECIASGIDRHPDRTEIYFRLQIQGNRKLIPCSRIYFLEKCLAIPTSPFFIY